MKARIRVTETREYVVETESLDLEDLEEAWAMLPRTNKGVPQEATVRLVEVVDGREGPAIDVRAPAHEPDW